MRKILAGAAYATTGLVKAATVTRNKVRIVMPGKRWDGEAMYDRAFDFSILPRRLNVILPPKTPQSWQ